MTAPINSLHAGERCHIEEGGKKFGVHALATRYIVVAPNGETESFDFDDDTRTHAGQQVTFWIRRWVNTHLRK